MAIKIVVPRLGWTMEKGTFQAWLKQDGEPVAVGDLLFVLENDKAAQEVESLDAGILRIAPAGPRPGDTVCVGDLLGYLVEPGEEAPLDLPAPGFVPEKITREPGVARLVQASVPGQRHDQPSSGSRPTISPRAARIASELGIDWTQLSGSGRSGRIVERDVRIAANALTSPLASQADRPPQSEAGQRMPLSQVRKIIAERMLAGSQSAAPVTLITRVDATLLVMYRNELKPTCAVRGRRVPTYTDLLVLLTAAALREHALLNACWGEDGIFHPSGIHIGMAVDTEAGLMVPVLRDVLSKPLLQLVDESHVLAEKARTRRLKPEEMQGGTFTLTNLGMHGIDAFTPILQLPQCAILGVGRIAAEPAIFEGQIVRRDMLTLSLTFDHRVVDGGPAARFLNTIRGFVEYPYPWPLG